MSVRKICQKARAQIRPCGTSQSTTNFGYIEFKEDINGRTSIKGVLKNLPPGIHGVHIHEMGEGKEQQGCEAFGEHYNPLNKLHGPRVKYGTNYTNPDRHLGDLGNINVKSDGTCEFLWMDDLVKLSGPHNVSGRSILIHTNHDEVGNFRSKYLDSHSDQRSFYGIINCE